MSKLTRFTQLLFGTTASNNQISEFGSLANGTPTRYSGSTITPALAQGLSSYWNSGWSNAVEGAYSPCIEDMNALFYVAFYQLCYLMQEGVAEWDAGTTYFIGSIVNSGGSLYNSLTNNNLNNPVSSAVNWSAVGDDALYVNSETALTSAISTCTTNGGGLITLTGSFTVSSAHTIPIGTVLIGKKGQTVVTLSGSGALTLSSGARMQDVWFTTALSSGNLVTLSNNYSIVRECQFTVLATSTVNCIYVTGNSNRMYNNIFIGVAAETGEPYGIYYASGVDNTDDSSVFLP